MSKGLEALKDISWQFDLNEKAQDEYKIVEKELKALDIINNKKVFVDDKKEVFIIEVLNLTQEEYELLEEILSYGK